MTPEHPLRSQTVLRGAAVSISAYLHEGFTTVLSGTLLAKPQPLSDSESVAAVAGALVTIVAHMLDVAKTDPELGEWMRYQLLADVPPDGQAAQTQHNILALGSIRAESEAR